ncbi:MAG: pilus assembly protein [Planctomycetes bacterium]|nr:pilus assembly protein [Planctomycetota bacterium]
MNREILIACIPCFVVLCAATVVLRLVLAVGASSWKWHRLRQVHACQQGGVQSLAFVLTMPIFVMVVLLIVQVSQLMIAQMVIHYAAFAGVRAASVWLPAAIDDPSLELNDFAEVENRVGEQPLMTDGDFTRYELTWDGTSQKLWKVRAATVQALMPLCPSRSVGARGQMPYLTNLALANQQAYVTLNPAAQSNSQLGPRLINKLNYADQNTRIFVEWRDAFDPRGRDPLNYKSYNPRNHTCPNPNVQSAFRPTEIGWQDPITVYVVHQFALLPGPGRFLAAQLVRADGFPDLVSPRINAVSLNSSRTLYTTQIQAAATMTCEGWKSVKPLVQPRYALPTQ